MAHEIVLNYYKLINNKGAPLIFLTSGKFYWGGDGEGKKKPPLTVRQHPGAD